MAIYEYCCGYCGEKVEVMQKISEPPLTTCASCGQDELKKMPSISAFHLKGGGWYNQGYESKSAQEKKNKKAVATKSDNSASTE